MPKLDNKIARMIQPESLRTDEFQPWSRGRGVDVWAMLCAAITGNLDTMKALVARDVNLLECEYEYLGPLHFAVRENQREVVAFLLEADANPVTGFGESLLTMARDRGYGELATLLEPTLKDRYHIVPEGAVVASAIKARDAAQVHALLVKQPELIHAADERGNQPIHWAVMTRQIDLIDDLLQRGADINAMRPDGARPLNLTNGDYYYRGWRDVPPTALQRHEVLIGYMLARGASHDISTAATIGHLDRVSELLDQDPGLANRVPPYSTYYSGLPLRCAARAGNLEVVKLLLARGANPNEPEPGTAPHGGALHAAIAGKHHDVVKLLLEHGANPNAAVESSGNCLSMAKHAGAPREMLDLIASYGGALTTELLCYNGDVETLAALLHANPQLHFDDHALHALIDMGHQHVVEMILRYQPELLKPFALRRAKTPEFARWLMERGLDPRRGNWLGITPLHRCAADGQIETASVCLAFGADIDAVDTEYCSTPLGWAARAGQKEMVEWLLKQGANADRPEAEPWALPLAWAARRGHHEISERLREFSPTDRPPAPGG